jgi:hypothetical protein
MIDPWYVTGLVEGQGAFTFSRSGRQMSLYFAIKLSESEREILEAIQDFFGGSGTIYRVKAGVAPTAGSGHTRAAAYYRVTRRQDLERIVEHFDQFPLRGAKAAAYLVWREMVAIKRAFRKPAREELDVLAARLSSVSPRGSRSG